MFYGIFLICFNRSNGHCASVYLVKGYSKGSARVHITRLDTDSTKYITLTMPFANENPDDYAFLVQKELAASLNNDTYIVGLAGRIPGRSDWRLVPYTESTT